MDIVLPDIHRAAHDEQCIEAFEIGDRFPGVEPHRRPTNASPRHDVAKIAGMLDGDVLEDQDVHGTFPSSAWLLG